MKSEKRTVRHSVVIAGGGPTGLLLAGELALAKVDVAIVERRRSQDLAGLRAGGLHPRTIEILDQRGIAERFVSKGQLVRRAPFAGATLDISDLPTRHNYFLALWQTHIEQILADWVSDFGVPIYRGTEVEGFTQDNDGVDVALSNGQTLRARYLVGCDGGRSQVRKSAAIGFPGWDASTSYLIAEVEMDGEPAWGIRRGPHGINALGRLEDGKGVRVVVNEPSVMQGGQPTLDDIRGALIGVYGTDFGLRSANYVSRFTDMVRQAAAYRDRRVLLAGDAAHVHSPVGGQGLNLGIQDAVNLGWKLAQVVHGLLPEGLLDTYHAERHPAGSRVLRNTMALTAAERGDDRSAALREMLVELMQRDEPRKQYLAMLCGLDVRYDLGEDHPQLGRRIPDLELTTCNGPIRIFTLLHTGRPLLLNLYGIGDFDATPWINRASLIDATFNGTWELPVLGIVSTPSAVLIRPDGHVAWVGGGTSKGLAEALSTWVGSPVQ